MLWLVLTKKGSKKEQQVTGTWVPKAQWCKCREKARPSVLIRKASVAQPTEKVNDGYDRNVSQHTVHHSMLWGCIDAALVSMPMLTPVHH